MAATDNGKAAYSVDDADDDSSAVRRPSSSRFHQQKLPAWQPLLTAGFAFPLFLFIGAVFIPVGAFLFVTSESLHEAAYDYTNCRNQDGLYCSELIAKPEYFLNHKTCQCNATIELTSNFTGQVYAFYALTNFYQNHRRYVKSRDDSQLLGNRNSDLLDDCDPYRQKEDGSWYAPCGAIASSIFNDTFSLFYHQSDGQLLEVPWTSEGIAWVSDRERKFGRVSNWNGTVKPDSWKLSARQKSSESFKGDEELLVWMRTAALPKFRKLHRIVQHDSNSTDEAFASGLPSGTYTLAIDYAFPVAAFSGTKSFVLATSAWIGGRNPSLGVLYMAVGCLHALLSIIFVFVHLHASRNVIVSLRYPENVENDQPIRTTSASGLVTNDQLANETEETAETDDNSSVAATEASKAKPRNMLQTLTLADY